MKRRLIFKTIQSIIHFRFPEHVNVCTFTFFGLQRYDVIISFKERDNFSTGSSSPVHNSKDLAA